jgi:hypothetical protein
VPTCAACCAYFSNYTACAKAKAPLLLQTSSLAAGDLATGVELELELIQIQMAQKPMLRAEVYARALRVSQNVKISEVWVGARCA